MFSDLGEGHFLLRVQVEDLPIALRQPCENNLQRFIRRQRLHGPAGRSEVIRPLYRRDFDQADFALDAAHGRLDMLAALVGQGVAQDLPQPGKEVRFGRTAELGEMLPRFQQGVLHNVHGIEPGAQRGAKFALSRGKQIRRTRFQQSFQRGTACWQKVFYSTFRNQVKSWKAPGPGRLHLLPQMDTKDDEAEIRKAAAYVLGKSITPPRNF